MNNTSLLFKTIAQITLGLTVLLIILGVIGYYNKRTSLESDLRADADHVAERLSASLPIALWNFDSEVANKAIEAEIASPLVNSITVKNSGEVFASRAKNLDGSLTDAEVSPRKTAFVLDVPLVFKEDGTANDVGTMHIEFNNDRMRKALSDALQLEVLRIVLMGVIAAILITLVIRSSVIRSIDQIKTAIEDIAQGEGDLTRRLPEDGVRELAQLSHAFNRFVERLDGLVKNIGQTSIQLAEKSRSGQVHIEDIRGELSNQKSEIDMIASASTELSSSTDMVAQNARNAADSAMTANDTAQSSHTTVTGAVEIIRQLSGEISQISDVIQTLVQEGENIGAVSGVIQGIAEQTNLLALNAAIEAARAGEQGRGFAVVADEVRTLAQRTQQSTEEINQMIERLQKSTEVADQAIRKGNESAESSVEKIEQAGLSITEVADHVSSINDMNSQIAQAASEQSDVISELNKNIVNISHNADSTSELADKTTSTSAAAMEMAMEMQEQMNKFKTS